MTEYIRLQDPKQQRSIEDAKRAYWTISGSGRHLLFGGSDPRLDLSLTTASDSAKWANIVVTNGAHVQQAAAHR